MEFHEIFTQLANLMTAVRMSHLSGRVNAVKTTKEHLVQNKEHFTLFAKSIESITVDKYKPKCDVSEDYQLIVVTMTKIAVGISKVEEMDNLPNLSESLERVGLFCGTETSELWINFKHSYMEYIKTSSASMSDLTPVRNFRMSAEMFSISVTMKVKKLRSRKRQLEDIDAYPKEIEFNEEEHHFEPNKMFSVQHTIDAYYAPAPNVALNWNHVRQVVYQADAMVSSFYRNSYGAKILGAFRNWFNIMDGSSQSIYSMPMRQWVYLGLPHMRNMAAAISRIPQSGQVLKRFLGCRDVMNRWFIPMLQLIAVDETNRIMKSAFLSTARDLGKYCR
jgi:hypothetical protein